MNVSSLPVCPNCRTAIHPVEGKVCSICGKRVSSYAEVDGGGLRRRAVCRRLDRPFERAASYGSYDGGLRELIHLLKYNGVRRAASVLGRMLADALVGLEPPFGQSTVIVVPVPLFHGKRRQRGFNQAELIARAALKSAASPSRFELNTEILVRTRGTHSQIGLTSHQRRENLRGAFAFRRAQEVTGREILLVDDVYTTGTTVSECARTLRRAGASKVWVVTAARTLKLASKYEELEPEETGFKVSEFQGFKEKSGAGGAAAGKTQDFETLKP